MGEEKSTNMSKNMNFLFKCLLILVSGNEVEGGGYEHCYYIYIFFFWGGVNKLKILKFSLMALKTLKGINTKGYVYWNLF